MLISKTVTHHFPWGAKRVFTQRQFCRIRDYIITQISMYSLAIPIRIKHCVIVRVEKTIVG